MKRRCPVRVATVTSSSRACRADAVRHGPGPHPGRSWHSASAGKVVERQAEIGDHVRAGQVLARLDPADLRLSEQAAQAALVAAQADAANTKADLARYDGLGRGSPAYLPSEYDRRVTAAFRMAAARLIQAERQVALAHDQSSYGSLLADADGVITALPVQVGQVVAAGQTVASLAHTNQTEIVVDVPENRLAEIRSAGDVAHHACGPPPAPPCTAGCGRWARWPTLPPAPSPSRSP